MAFPLTCCEPTGSVWVPQGPFPPLNLSGERRHDGATDNQPHEGSEADDFRHTHRFGRLRGRPEPLSRRGGHARCSGADWGEVFPNAACVVSLVDRLMHRAEVVRIEGESYRAKEADAAQAQRQAERAAKAAAVRSRKPAK